jgi:hypothetical protein
VLIYCTFTDECVVNIWALPASPCLSPTIALVKAPKSVTLSTCSVTTFQQYFRDSRSNSCEEAAFPTPRAGLARFKEGGELMPTLQPFLRSRQTNLLTIASLALSPSWETGFEWENSSGLLEFLDRNDLEFAIEARGGCAVLAARFLRPDGLCSMIWPRIFRIR